MPTRGVVVDARALQSHEHASRGIGRYTLELFREIERQDPELVRAYVADPSFPMHEQLRELLPTGKVVRGDAVELIEAPPRVAHVTSPFVEGHGPVRVLPHWARALDTRLVATVYDLIPARFPDVYLRDPAAAQQHAERVQFLRSCDRLLSISDATSADLVELAGVAPSRVRTIHGAAGAEFVPPGADGPELGARLDAIVGDAAPQGFVLCPTGIEWRKNLDRLLQAWARLDRRLRDGRPLLIQCHLSAESREHLEQRTAELDIRRDVVLVGSVSDPELVALMQAATLVVFPSLYEGLGLPVLEARRCGAPVICGDNSSLRELVAEPTARFDASDVDAIRDTIARHLDDAGARRRLAAEEIPDRYTWREVATQVIEVHHELLAAPVRALRRTPRRLAIASPVPPQLSGPSVYLAELLRGLPDHCDVTVFTTVDPASVELPRQVRVERLAALDQVERLEGEFDEVLYLLGNSPFHMEELAQLRRRPGAVLLHDARLTLLYSETFRSRPELLERTFGETLHWMYPGRYPAPMGGAQYLPMQEEALFGVLMIAEVARLATRLFVHSEHAADLIELDCARRPDVIFPIPCPQVWPDRPQPERVMVASFGFVSPAKCSEVVLAAARHVPGVEFALVGHSGEEFLSMLRADALEHGTADRVAVTGKVGEQEYREWLGRAGIAVQLRLHSNGESSASVAETLAAGVPTVVTDIGTFAEYPDDVVVKVPPGIGAAELGEVLRDLAADEPRRAALAAAGRAYAERHSYRHAAEVLAATLVPPAS